MTDPLRRQEPTALTDALDCAADVAIRLRGRNEYIVRTHVFDGDVHPRRATTDQDPPLAGVTFLSSLLALWRRRYLTRRQLSWLDRRGLADIGIDPAACDREVTKPFWKS